MTMIFDDAPLSHFLFSDHAKHQKSPDLRDSCHTLLLRSQYSEIYGGEALT